MFFSLVNLNVSLTFSQTLDFIILDKRMHYWWPYLYTTTPQSQVWYLLQLCQANFI